MARICALTGKRTKSGNNKPFSLKRTKRTFRPNLFKVRITDPVTGQTRRVKLSAKAIKTLKKWENEAAEKMQREMVAKGNAATEATESATA